MPVCRNGTWCHSLFARRLVSLAMVKDSLSRRTFGADDDDDDMASFPYNFRYAVLQCYTAIISRSRRQHHLLAALVSFRAAELIIATANHSVDGSPHLDLS